jgi:hypothetical protein
MRIGGELVEIVERAYDVEAATPAWLSAIRDAAGRAFGGHIATQAYTFAISKDGRFDLHEISSDPEWEELLRRAHSVTDTTIIRRLYLGGPINSVRTATSDRFARSPASRGCVSRSNVSPPTSPRLGGFGARSMRDVRRRISSRTLTP